MQSDRTILRGHLDDLSAFAAVARALSFTRAAAKLADWLAGQPMPNQEER